MKGKVSRLHRKERFLDRTLKDEENCSRSLPHAIIFGVMKCGTETLSTFLSIHPNVSMQFKVRAVMFFTKFYYKGLEWYRNQMPCSKKGQITIEKSPQYFQGKDIPDRIYKINKTIKLIAIIREPISRTISHFMQRLSTGHNESDQSFEETILNTKGDIDVTSPLIVRSLYVISIKRWLKTFTLKQIHVVDGDNFKTNPSDELNKLETFLGLKNYISKNNFNYNEEKGFYCLNTSGGINCMPNGKGRKHPTIDPGLLQKLQEFFKPYNEELFSIIGKRFDWHY